MCKFLSPLALRLFSYWHLHGINTKFTQHYALFVVCYVRHHAITPLLPSSAPALLRSGMLYVWLPANSSSAYWSTAPWGSPVVAPITGERAAARRRAGDLAAAAAASTGAATVVGELSVDDFLLDLQPGTSHLSFENMVFTSARNAGIRAVSTSDITVKNCVLENFGSMAVNVSGGSGFVLDSSVVRGAGNGAVLFYAGDRITLTGAGHTVCSCRTHTENKAAEKTNRHPFYFP